MPSEWSLWLRGLLWVAPLLFLFWLAQANRGWLAIVAWLLFAAGVVALVVFGVQQTIASMPGPIDDPDEGEEHEEVRRRDESEPHGPRC